MKNILITHNPKELIFGEKFLIQNTMVAKVKKISTKFFCIFIK